MTNTKLDIDKIFNLVMTCRKSGMSDRHWCNEHAINPSTLKDVLTILKEALC